MEDGSFVDLVVVLADRDKGLMVLGELEVDLVWWALPQCHLCQGSGDGSRNCCRAGDGPVW